MLTADDAADPVPDHRVTFKGHCAAEFLVQIVWPRAEVLSPNTAGCVKPGRIVSTFGEGEVILA